MRRALIKRIDPRTLRSNGYAFQVELKARMAGLSARIVETPIVFTGRVEGESKLSRMDVFEAAFAVWRLRIGKRSAAGRGPNPNPPT